MIFKSSFPDPGQVTDTNVHHIFFGRPDQATWGNHAMFIDADTGKSTSYHQLLRRVKAGATILCGSKSQGGLELKNGDMVGIMSDNSTDYVNAIHSSIYAALPFVLISSYSTRFELIHTLRVSQVAAVLANAKYVPLLLSVCKEVGLSSKDIYVLGGHINGRQSFPRMIDQALKQQVGSMAVRPVSRDDLAYLVFSSGTTGLPKAVMITYGNLMYSMKQVTVVGETATAQLQLPSRFPITLAILPLHHTYGLHAYVFRSFMVPATYVLMPKWNIDVALKLIPKYRITDIQLIPSIIQQLVSHPRTRKTDLSSVMSISSGAAYLPPELADQLSEILPKQLRFSEGYGMSEMTIAGLSKPIPGMFGLTEIPKGTAGIVLPGMDARIIKEDGTEAGINEVGELYMRGANIAKGYYDNPAATAETFVDGWVRSGDRFSVDKDGFFFFADRSKDTLKVSGSQVSPVEIENVLLAHPDKLISDVTVAGVSGGRISDEKVPRAWIVLSPSGRKLGVQAVVKELEVWHQENLSKYKWLRGGIEVVRKIPKSPTGKTLRRELQDRYEKRQLKVIKAKL